MAYTQKYLTDAEWATFRNLTPSASTSPTDTQVTLYIEIAEKEFDRDVCDYSLQSDQEYIANGHARGITVPYPVSNINGLQISNGDIITPTWSVIPSTDYALKENGRILLRNPYIHREYNLNFDSGYAIADVPNDVKYLVYLMSMRHAFNAHLFEQNVSDSTTRIVDVEVYREITKGGDAFKGFSALDKMIDTQKANLKGYMKTRLG